MRVTEQIDALEVMGINSLNYLIFPKVIAMLTYPFVIAIAMFTGIFGAYIAGYYGGFISSSEFMSGLREDFIPYHLVYAFLKTFLFSFLLATIPSFHGYYLKGGSVEVGKIADLVILDKNPLSDIKNSTTVSSVIMNGVLYDTAKIEELKNFTASVSSSFHVNVKLFYSLIDSPLIRMQFAD